jgi:GrpB-like predicted nucleotidyltransferase (UPF0157 family)
MLGLDQGTVRLTAYHPAWARLFEEEARVLQAALGGLVGAIEHVGSTAVPGLAAKPIIDVMGGLRRIEDVAACVPVLEGLGYEYKGEYGIPGRHFFVKGAPRTHHLHLVRVGSAFWEDHLLFRDYLRRHPEEAAAYARLKHDLAARHAADREAYTDSKTAFICGVLERARAEQGGPAPG